jgi:hypothetical protein
MRRVALALLVVLAFAGCSSNNLAIQSSGTACIVPGQVVNLEITTEPGTELTIQAQDDFAGEIPPPVTSSTAGASGKASISWQSPGTLSTTTVHFIVSGRNGERRASKDIHVIVGANGRSC